MHPKAQKQPQLSQYTKIGRLNERDLQDIESCIRKFNLEKSQIERRARMVQYAGNEKVYEIILQHVL
jgi:hypothetical protein